MKLKLILVFVLILLISYSTNSFAESNVTVFILDSKVDYGFVKDGTPPISGEITHGSIVGRIIYQEVKAINLLAYNVDTEQGIDQELYFSGLQKILEYKDKYPSKKIIVNISLSILEKSKKHHNLIKKLTKEGVVIIAAAGNDNANHLIYPAGFKETIAVGNATKAGKAASSNYGKFIDLCAPGNVKYISRLYLPQGVTVNSLQAVGTSFSAPRVVGLLAKLLSLEPKLSIKEGLELILANTQDIEDPKFKQDFLGAGVINPSQTLAQVAPYHYLKTFGPQLILGIIFVGLILYWIKKYRVVGFFLSLLLFLVILPVVVIIQEIFLADLQYLIANYRQFQIIDYLILFLGPIILIIFTTWKQKFIILSYIIWLVLLIFSLPIIKQLSIAMKIYLKVAIIIWTLLLIFREQWKLYQIKKEENPYDLIKLLTSSSKAVVRMVKKKIKNNSFPIDRLLFELKEEQVDFSIIKELVLAQNDNIVDELIAILDDNPELLSLIIDLLAELDSDLVLEKLKVELGRANDQKKIYLLKLISKIKGQDLGLIKEIEDILLSANGMWLREQALKTLAQIHPQREKMKLIIKELTTDEQELVRLEAKSLWSKLK